jgi:hypothetical protein
MLAIVRFAADPDNSEAEYAVFVFFETRPHTKAEPR